MSLPQTYRRVEYSAYGDRNVMSIKQIPLPVIEPTEVLIKVAGASLNPVDSHFRDGKFKSARPVHFPSGIGYDVSGEVVAIGSNVTEWKVGDKVVARSRKSNTVGEYATAHSDVVAKAPTSTELNAASGLPLAGQTALQGLRQCELKQGDRILITGGAGGVGHFAVQLAKRVFKAGAVVSTGSPKKFDFLKSLGADEVLDYKDLEKIKSLEKFDAIFDCAGEAVLVGPLIKSGRTLITCSSAVDNLPGSGFFLGIVLWFLSRSARNAARSVGGDYHFMWLSPNTKDLTELVGYIDQGLIKIHVDRVVSGLDNFQQAFEVMETGHVTGKIVISV